MGKPFTSELTKLADTLEWVGELDVSPLVEFFANAIGKPLIAIGAGGSYTAAEFSRLLFESHGGVAITHTPLSFLESGIDLRQVSVVLFTAGGNNRDVVACFQAMTDREAANILVVCGAHGSKIEAKTAQVQRAILFNHPIPSGKDGYLATNSLIAFSAIVLRAFGHKIPSRETVNRIITTSDEHWKKLAGDKVSNYYLAIYADWARPAAVDLESKFGEAGLAGVTPADYRNFAHGRHNWIAKKGQETTLLAFITPASELLAKKTLQLLPETTRIIEFKVSTDGPTGGLELLLQVFRFTAFIGQRRGIDPGKPGVPRYGSLLYRLGPVIYKTSKSKASQTEAAAINRKQAARGTLGNDEDRTKVRQAFSDYIKNLQKSTFGALVVDFDGTVAAPGIGSCALDPKVQKLFIKLLDAEIPIYFATGRGDSIQKNLILSFPKAHWSRIFVSYYNGAFTLPLSESAAFRDQLKQHQVIDDFYEVLEKDALLRSDCEINNKFCQITIKVKKARLNTVNLLIAELVAKEAASSLRVVQSSHSIDIIPLGNTKFSTIQFASKSLKSSHHVLTVGDRGALPGNDFDLLSHSKSLSVDVVSSSLNSCWNLLPAGLRNIQGLLKYGEWLSIEKGFFNFAMPRGGARNE